MATELPAILRDSADAPGVSALGQSVRSRRQVLLSGIGVVGALLLPGRAWSGTTVQLLSPASRAGQHYAVCLDMSGDDTRPAHRDPVAGVLPMRGHGLLPDPRHPGQALVIARRPGTTVVRIDLARGEILQQWEAGNDRHFFGHACYSADGRTLFVVENDVAAGTGVISVRDADDLSVQDEYRTHGIGPHDILLMPDGVTLAIANGGIQTLPETGRVKLNRGHIASGLVYLDSRDGALLGNYPLSLAHTSLRHLALASNGRLAAALQYEGDRAGRGVPLMVFHAGETSLQTAAAPQAAWNRMQHYAASVAFDRRSERFALSCPRGDTLACWGADGNFSGCVTVPQVSGIAFGAAGGFASNARGEVYRLDLLHLSARLLRSVPGTQWDNHLYLG